MASEALSSPQQPVVSAAADFRPAREEAKVAQAADDSDYQTVLLARANASINGLKKSDLTELKSLKSPSREVLIVS